MRRPPRLVEQRGRRSRLPGRPPLESGGPRERGWRGNQEWCAMERLTAQDLSMLWPDDAGWPQDIGALAFLQADGLFDAGGRCRVEAVRETIEARLHLVPRFRQRLLLPRRGLGWPLWVDADD